MTSPKGILKVCPKGHKFYKSSDCPSCPTCAAESKPTEGFLSLLSAPARRAMESIGVKTVKQLSKHTQKEIMALHGVGKASLPTFLKALKDEALTFKE